ncbi:MAG: sigma-E processing peptidase SpoIIGA [Butyribacter sp.]|nr:sigma-E processing peptidase SpoIIGA [bacterium]MDY3855281.1 sigma-E processing peptidase SpoIIGA [Butyribacter sp.]
MKTYLYLDVYIFLNFIMNLFLIMITAIVRQKKSRIFCMILVSLAVSLFSAATTWLLWGKNGWQLVCAVFQMMILVFFSFPYEGKSVFAGDFLAFLFLAFFSGGCIGACMNFLSRWTHSGKGIACGEIITAVVILFILFFLFRWEILKQRNQKRNVLSAKIIHRKKEYQIRALFDTGNSLVSPYTGERVAVISKKLAQQMALEKEQNPILIPYSSIGGKGLMKAYRIEEICFADDRTEKDFLAAVSENLGTENEIQMIFNNR